MPSMEHSTTSPGFRNFGGSKPMPTPDGVPVEMMVPGSSVMPEDNCFIAAGAGVDGGEGAAEETIMIYARVRLLA